MSLKDEVWHTTPACVGEKYLMEGKMTTFGHFIIPVVKKKVCAVGAGRERNKSILGSEGTLMRYKLDP